MADSIFDDDAGVAVDEPVVRPREKSEPLKHEETDDHRKTKKQPPYAVIIENDEFHTWPYVIDVLQRVCGHSKQRAYVLTSSIHHMGEAIVWTGTLELAELRRDQIRGFGADFYALHPVKFPLTVRLEPLPVD
ncbi:MAG: ATP-dependent Clp protease adaptor ClpS [Planctomycetota bacterium]|nr:ATP-dependent Clp protease adaptor ClpS [Planctomycetota bacterium]MDA1211411.1 ATP-dependent Clp protease adaptor ClpS [Planctomycetota bacterium]